MGLKTTLLGLAAMAASGAAIALQMLYVSETISLVSWGVAAFLALLWAALNRSMLWSFLTRKSTRYGANTALVVFLVLGILVFVNILAKEHNWRRDLTRTGANTLSEQTLKILSDLPQDVRAQYFSGINAKEKGDDLLGRYAYRSRRFHYEFVDVARRPTLVKSMGVTREGQVALSLGETGKRVLVDGPTEEQVTNGLVKLLRSGETAVYFSTGHGEHSITAGDQFSFGQFKAELDKQGYTVKELSLLSEGKVPADAAVLVVGGPTRSFYPKELEIFAAWLKQGGRAFVSMELDVNRKGLAAGSSQIAELLRPYGIQVMSQMLVDPTSRAANVEPQILLGFSGSREHPITRDFAQSLSIFLFPLTTYLAQSPGGPLQLTPLAVTSPNAWAESDWDSVRRGNVSFDRGVDRRGSMDLAYAAEGAEGGPKAPRLVVFANSYFAANDAIDKRDNRDLVLNAIAWLADEDRFISIRPREDPDALRRLGPGVLNLVLLVTVVLVPLAVGACGVFVWWRRKKL